MQSDKKEGYKLNKEEVKFLQGIGEMMLNMNISKYTPSDQSGFLFGSRKLHEGYENFFTNVKEGDFITLKWTKCDIQYNLKEFYLECECMPRIIFALRHNYTFEENNKYGEYMPIDEQKKIPEVKMFLNFLKKIEEFEKSQEKSTSFKSMLLAPQNVSQNKGKC